MESKSTGFATTTTRDNLQLQSAASHYQLAHHRNSHQSVPVTMFSQQNFSSSQENGERPAYNRFVAPQQAHSLSHTQNVGYLQNNELYTKKKTSVSRRYTYQTPTTIYQSTLVFKSSSNSLYTTSLLFSGHAIWTQPGPINVHENNHRSSQIHPHPQDSSINVYRRLDSVEQLKPNTSLVTKLLLQLGVTVNWKKSQLTPANTIVYLGVLWNGTAYTITPSPQNMEKVVGLVAKVLSKGNLGTLNFIAPLVHQGKFQLK